MHEGRWAEVAGRDDLVGERKELRSRVRGDDDAALSNVSVALRGRIVYVLMDVSSTTSAADHCTSSRTVECLHSWSAEQRDAAWKLALTGPGHPVVILVRLESVVRVDLMPEVDPHGHAVLEGFRDVLF
jgi:hypothetical protein